MNNKKGFTLIELLVVIAIIGLLSTLAVVALGSARQKSRDAKRLSDLKQIQTALELYYTDSNQYPVSTASTTLGAGNFACLGTGGFGTSGCATPYMALVPVDPTASQNYSYSTDANGTTYTITATLEGAAGGLSAGAITASPAGLQ